MGAATAPGMAAEWAVERVLKRDALGRVELVTRNGVRAVRRVACGGRLPLSRAVARVLLARERRALGALDGLAGVARVLDDGNDDGNEAGVLLRGFVPGVPLCLATTLPRDFFERLEELARALHAHGVCHNDLHKEANVLVGDDGYPALVDFQLASVHRRRGRAFDVRAREDLRHVWKHRAHYLRGLGEPDAPHALPPRSFVAEAWRRCAKPLVRRLTRALGDELASGEARRAKDAAWPRWSAPVGPRGE